MPDTSKPFKSRPCWKLQRGGAAPMIILLVILLAAAAVFVYMRTRGPTMNDYRQAVTEQRLLLEDGTKADADEFFKDPNPKQLPQNPTDPRDEEGNLLPPTADDFLYTVNVGGETMYVKVRVNRTTGRVLSVREADSEGNEI